MGIQSNDSDRSQSVQHRYTVRFNLTVHDFHVGAVGNYFDAGKTRILRKMLTTVDFPYQITNTKHLKLFEGERSK
jgi:hypothetical protein